MANKFYKFVLIIFILFSIFYIWLQFKYLSFYPVELWKPSGIVEIGETAACFIVGIVFAPLSIGSKKIQNPFCYLILWYCILFHSIFIYFFTNDD